MDLGSLRVNLGGRVKKGNLGVNWDILGVTYEYLEGDLGYLGS